MANTLNLERPVKRRRISNSEDPVTPPAEDVDNGDILGRALHVLTTEATALANIRNLYQTDRTAKQALFDALNTICKAQAAGGKLIACGVGKSAYIAMKLVATCKSLGVAASFMHACEAAHGDLGDIRASDVLLFVSFSGKTPELLNLLPHVPATTPVIAMSSHLQIVDCPLLAGQSNGILLPTPIPQKEEVSFGVAAPTTSTTVSLAVADMLVLITAELMHQGEVMEVFKRNHPGGAIGMNHQEVEALKDDGVDFTVLELPSPSISGSDKG